MALYLTQWLLIPTVAVFLIHTVAPLSIKSKPTYSIINMDEEPVRTVERGIPRVTRRGYAGDDFYQKASKSIPRMGRRSGTNSNTCFYKLQDFEDGLVEDESISLTPNAESFTSESTDGAKRKRSNLVAKEVSNWPWYTDNLPNIVSKRTEINGECYYEPKFKDHVSDRVICCPIGNDSSVFKRSLSSRYSSKRTTTNMPDYKSNLFM